MALIRIIQNKHNQIGLWSLEEEPAELEQLISLSRHDQLFLEKMTSRFRRREFLSVRILMTELLGRYPEILYDSHHRPYLAGREKHISISHSRSLVAVIAGERPAGIDTEELHRDISPIIHRFMNAAEITWSSVAPDPSRAQVLCWSIKESVFKLMATENVDFRSMISIDPVGSDNLGRTTANFRMSKETVSIEVHYLFEQNNVITWCELP